jgi:hypothetical protein
VDGRIEKLLGGFGIEAADEFCRVLEIGKEHGDLLALTFAGTARGENFLCKVGRRVRERLTLRLTRRGRDGQGREDRITGPDETAPRIVTDLRVGVEQLVLEVVEGVLV